MKKIAGNRKLTVLVTLIIIVLSWIPTTSAMAQEQPLTVRVGVYESNGFIALNESNEMTGYGADFMRLLADYGNIRYEYVKLSWSDCLQGLRDGTIDIVTDARRSPERDKEFDFSTQCIGQIQAAIFVPEDAEDIYFNDYPRMSQLLIGFEKDALNLPLYEEYAALHGFQTHTVEYETTSDLMVALKRGEIDAIGGDVHIKNDGLKVISVYHTDPNYIMAKKGSPIMRRINLAVSQMYADDMDLISGLFTGITSRQMYGKILFTREEAQYIKEHPTLRVAVYQDRKPASWYDSKSGTYHGIAIDVMDQLSDITGIQFEYVPLETEGHSTNVLTDESIDLVLSTISKDYYVGEIPARITYPLYSLSVALAYCDETHLSENGSMNVALTTSNDGIKTMLSNYYPNMSFTRFETVQECIDAVRSGQADAYGNAMYELEYCLKNPRNNDLKIAYSFSCPIDFCIGMRMDTPDELYRMRQLHS